MVKFAFRQRVGKINWNIVSAVSIQDVIEQLQLNELQSVLDAVTFCEFGSSDVKNSSIDTVAQLIQIFQFIVEFLLHSQEMQNVLIERMHRKNRNLKETNQQLSAQVVTLREDTKIYQRQLSVLRHSMGIRDPQHPKVTNLRKNEKDTSDIQPILASVLQHEKESREFLKTLLDDQRINFMKELELNRQTVVTVQEPDKRMYNKDDKMEKYIEELKFMLAQQQEQNLQQQEKERKLTSSEILASEMNKLESSKINKMKKELEELQKNMNLKEKDILEREENLKFDIRDHKNMLQIQKDKERAKIYLSSVDSLKNLKLPSDNNEIFSKFKNSSRNVSAMMIRNTFKQALQRQISGAFRIWINKTNDYKERGQISEHSRLLVSAAASHNKKEQDLLAQIKAEKLKATSMNEKERLLHEAALKKSLFEQQALLDAANEKARLSQANTVTTSTEQLFPLLSKGITLDPWLIAAMNLRLGLDGEGLSEEDALRLAHLRILQDQKNGENDRTHKEHSRNTMNNLAAEITTRLKLSVSAAVVKSL